jgi:hypothetical protein
LMTCSVSGASPMASGGGSGNARASHPIAASSRLWMRFCGGRGAPRACAAGGATQVRCHVAGAHAGGQRGGEAARAAHAQQQQRRRRRRPRRWRRCRRGRRCRRRSGSGFRRHAGCCATRARRHRRSGGAVEEGRMQGEGGVRRRHDCSALFGVVPLLCPLLARRYAARAAPRSSSARALVGLASHAARARAPREHARCDVRAAQRLAEASLQQLLRLLAAHRRRPVSARAARVGLAQHARRRRRCLADG